MLTVKVADESLLHSVNVMPRVADSVAKQQEHGGSVG